MAEQNTESQNSSLEALKQRQIFDIKIVGPDTISASSIMGVNETLAGNVLRRLCKLGGEACAKTCALHQAIIDRAEANLDAKCADDNLSQIVAELGLVPENVFMVGVTANEVGFADEADDHPEKYKYSINEKTRLKELAGFNSFWAAQGDSIGGDEVYALGRRLADCGDINVEYVNVSGKKIMGFMHMTRTNLEGNGRHHNVRNGLNMEEPSYRYFMNSVFDHYGNPDTARGIDVRISAAIKKENFVYRFTDQAKMDEMFPGWNDTETPFTDGRQLIFNKSNPDWKPGDSFSPQDEFEVDFRGMLEWQLRQFAPAAHLTRVNGQLLTEGPINWLGVIDPGDSESQHASNARGKQDAGANGRDAYFTIWSERLGNKP